MTEHLLSLVRGRQGHFKLESGHHGDLWLELGTLCQHSRELQSFAARLAERLVQHKVEAVCGPLIEGAFVALLVSLGHHYFPTCVLMRDKPRKVRMKGLRRAGVSAIGALTLLEAIAQPSVRRS
jgi:orotate phosphoribosyltransferase